MRYIMTFIWSVLIASAISYVLTSMAGEPFVMGDALVLAVLFTLTAIITGEVILKPEKNN
ncbi:DUF2929 family protein [Oceanobacillus saliphilus]|uniref:DUF2929 family protein n=1 Tax=Oceanobacillus saliphilus TaxID=2925834 RepID=UPI00201D9B6C|nr:DUF2929 family protein [Oceanobacillus saliphilus]